MADSRGRWKIDWKRFAVILIIVGAMSEIGGRGHESSSGGIFYEFGRLVGAIIIAVPIYYLARPRRKE